MARETRKKISYELPLASSVGHRLGVNGLAVDNEQSILYTGGRDGSVIAWDLHLDLKNMNKNISDTTSSQNKTKSTFWSQVTEHTHWVNDIKLAQNTLISASSDLTVRAWRPHSEEEQNTAPVLGKHGDYVKCLSTPGNHADWIASGALDHRICLWDLNGAGEKLNIHVAEGLEERLSCKCSTYALGTGGPIIASGGPERVVRIWDSRSGGSITKFAGHTDLIRDILVNQNGDTVMSASADQTVKVWSLTAGRCLHTFTMHNASVWSLYSDHPDLSVFYSSDRSGLVAKTDVRNVEDWDDGFCVAVCQENDPVCRTVAAGDHIWTATASASINRWKDVDTSLGIEIVDSAALKADTSPENEAPATSPAQSPGGKARVPIASMLHLTDAAIRPGLQTRDPDAMTLYSTTGGPKALESGDVPGTSPLRDLPEETIEGQHGLIKHYMLNDKKRVLTLDTAGEVVLWDILKCRPIKSFGKRHLEDVAPEINTSEVISNWCTVDTRTGKLAVMLESNYCFDAEHYLDEIEFEEMLEFREEQRVNFGKWVLRYLFDQLVDEEIRQDSDFRRQLLETVEKKGRANAPTSIALPTSSFLDQDPAATPKASNGAGAPMTPGLTIGLATPGLPALQTDLEGNSPLEKRASHHSQSSTEKRNSDYFSSGPNAQNSRTSEAGSDADGKTPVPASATTDTALSSTASPTVDDNEGKKKKGTFFSKKLQFPKKLGRSSLDTKSPAADKPEEMPVTAEKEPEKEEKTFEDNFFGVIQRIRSEYEEQLSSNNRDTLGIGITPSLPSETPILKLPPDVEVIIQEDKPNAGGVADLWRGTVGSMLKDVSIIEQMAPVWLGELLLRNSIPSKVVNGLDTNKMSFFLFPYDESLPKIDKFDGVNGAGNGNTGATTTGTATNGNSNGNNANNSGSRLSAHRMLRGKKILAYVAERLEELAEPNSAGASTITGGTGTVVAEPTTADDESGDSANGTGKPAPEEWLDLYCQGQIVPHNTTLITMRTILWKAGGEPTLYFRLSGNRPCPLKAYPLTKSSADAAGEEGDAEKKELEMGEDEAVPLTPGPVVSTA